MNILAYCYGPTCEEKELFCKEFTEENKDYQIFSSSKIRQQISGDIFVKNKETEEKVIEQLIEECVKTFTKNKKRKNILINGLFLNQESRLKLINLLELNITSSFKKVAIAFLPKSSISTYESLKNKKEFKNLDFDYIKRQFLNFKYAESKEEADLIIERIQNYNGKFNLECCVWKKQEVVECDSFNKIAEFVKHINSF